jgi:hypothetical protein
MGERMERHVATSNSPNPGGCRWENTITGMKESFVEGNAIKNNRKGWNFRVRGGAAYVTIIETFSFLAFGSKSFKILSLFPVVEFCDAVRVAFLRHRQKSSAFFGAKCAP